MIYAVLNIAFTLFLSWLALYTDSKTGGEGSSPVISLNVLLAAACGVLSVTIATSGTAPSSFTSVMGELVYALFGIYIINFSIYCIMYPLVERNLFIRLAGIGGSVWCVWAVFFHFTGVTVTNFIGLNVESMSIFYGNLSRLLPYNWFDLYRAIIFVVVPAFAILIMLLRSETREGRLDHQKTILNAIACFLGWAGLFVISKANNRVAMFSTLFMAPFVLAQWVVVRAIVINFLYDINSIGAFFVRGFACYIIPAIIAGIAFAGLWPIHMMHPVRFYVYLLAVISALVAATYQFIKFFDRRVGFRTQQYAARFEEDLSNFDFSDDPENIVRNMQEIFKRNIGMSFMRILIESGNEDLDSVYDLPEEKHLKVSIKGRLFDSILNQNKRIVLKSQVESSLLYSNIRKDLLELFASTGSDAIIILNEGRHILGLIVLGQKSGGNIYTDYDNEVFTKLYSYFFVLGYYMKNIGNQDIVGTVNREIRMSEQIIGSIQGNMDPIKNKRYDYGTMMIHAHNIGGEFIDLIKLSEDRHIFVMGDLSGKGIAASMSMVIVKSVIRTFLQETKDFKLLVEKVNQFIRYNLPKGTFFEGVFGLIDFNENTIYYINCAVPALFLYNRAYNNVMEIQGEGHVLGFVKDIGPYLKVKKVKLNPGDVVFAVTDGILDSKSLRGEPFGKDRVQKAIAENTSVSAENMARAAYDSLINFLSKELDDDVSIFSLKLLK
ncbi:MAG: serine/threonine-protein phosphatase [Treponema sp.]|nr:serine/threonine-protein phosphatase [Candidatus Treponema equifaecale]